MFGAPRALGGKEESSFQHYIWLTRPEPEEVLTTSTDCLLVVNLDKVYDNRGIWKPYDQQQFQVPGDCNSW